MTAGAEAETDFVAPYGALSRALSKQDQKASEPT
jgi:hypothetical protein